MAIKTGILTYEQFHGGRNIGSSRIRGQWLANHWAEAELFKVGRRYETVIFQKVYWIEYFKQFQGTKILDLCDPDFLLWYHPIRSILELCDAATVATVELRDFVRRYTSKPVVWIPDRIDLDSLAGLSKHHRGQGDTKIAAWYGYSQNFGALDSIVGDLPGCGIQDLVVIAGKDLPYCLPSGLAGQLKVHNWLWTPETIAPDLLTADIVLNPQPSSGRWIYKSNNKTTYAWALGLPVAHTREQILALRSEEARIAESELRREQVSREYDIRESVNEYQMLIEGLRTTSQGLVSAAAVEGS
jgi:hypothetical protein